MMWLAVRLAAPAIVPTLVVPLPSIFPTAWLVQFTLSVPLFATFTLLVPSLVALAVPASSTEELAPMVRIEPVTLLAATLD